MAAQTGIEMRSRGWIGVALAIGITTPAIGAGTMSLEQVLAIATSDTPDHQLNVQQRSQAEAEADGLIAHVLPRVDLEMKALRAGQSSQQQMYSSIPGLPDHIWSTQYDWGMRVTSPLYSFGRFGHLYDAYNKRRELIEVEFRSRRDDYLLGVVTAYNRALQANNQRRSAQNSRRYAKKLLQFTQIEFRRGAISRIDLLRSQAFMAQAEAALAQADQAYDSSHSRLRFLLGLPSEQTLRLNPALELKGRFFETPSGAATTPTAVQQGELGATFAGHMKDYYRARFWPDLSLFAQVGANTMNAPTLGREDSFGDAFASERYGYSFGVQFTWNLFDGFATSSAYRKAVAESKSAGLQLARLRDEMAVQLREGTTQLSTARRVFRARKKSAEAAELFFEQLDSDFQNGAAALSDVLEAESQWSQAEEAVYQAYTEIITATANLRRVRGEPVY